MSTSAQLYAMAGGAWSEYASDVSEPLALSPRDAVLFALRTLKDPLREWQLAHELELAYSDTWSDWRRHK